MAYSEDYRKRTIEYYKRIYIDESGVSQFCHRSFAHAVRGQRVHGLIPGKKFARINVVGGYCDGRILGEFCYKGSTTADKFEYWICTFLLPETRAGDVVIMDNARFHNKKRLHEYARVYKVTVVFLPPYSPDYNPIKHVWANMKRFLSNTVLAFR